MPRQPKREKQSITVMVEGRPIAVSLLPPSGPRKSWYAYWNGLKFSKSTGQSRLEAALVVAEHMVRNAGSRPNQDDSVISDDEFIEIQKRHFGKKKESKAQERAAKSLASLLEAIDAFRLVTNLSAITLATPDDCERFQHEATELPKNWRSKHPKSKKDVETLSPTTIDKWSRALQAAWERANRNAGRKCIRGVIPEKKLLGDNPWHRFTWISKRAKPIRQFDGEELLSLLKYLDIHWSGVTIAPALSKLCLWSGGRRIEIASLTWDALREVSGEYHFDVTGKWGVRKWFRVPEMLYRDLIAIRTESPFVFSAYNEQLREFHHHSLRPWVANRVTQKFDPANLGDWFYKRISDWSETLPKGSASVHVFRKTTLQYARRGEDVNRQLAEDARVTENVLMTSYVEEMDPELHKKSNRMFHRIAASLPPAVAKEYGFVESEAETLKRRLRAAVEAEDYQMATRLIAQIAKRQRKARNTA